jgi:hypothetical protein
VNLPVRRHGFFHGASGANTMKCASSADRRATQPPLEDIMKDKLTQRSVAAVAAAVVTFAIFSAVVAVADHEKDQAVFLAARIKPQALAETAGETKQR